MLDARADEQYDITYKRAAEQAAFTMDYNKAALAARVFLARQEGSSIICVDDRRIDFVAPSETKLRGLTSIYLKARQRDRAGDVARIANVDFKLV